MNAILLRNYFIKTCTDVYCSLQFLYILFKLRVDNYGDEDDGDDLIINNRFGSVTCLLTAIRSDLPSGTEPAVE